MTAENIVSVLSSKGIRTDARKADHYSGNILRPLGLDSCVRVSMCHYNTEVEVAQFLCSVEYMIKKIRKLKSNLIYLNKSLFY